jgi:hypothetical protein
MRTLYFMLGIVIASAAISTCAESQTYPWCALYSGGGAGGATNCGFSTYQQCMEDVSGIGGFCQLNDWYKPPIVTPARHKSHTHS